MNILAAFEVQAGYCHDLGSPFTARVLRALAELLTPETAVGRRVLNWQGDPSTGADSVPLRLSGGLHAVVLKNENPALSACYPPNNPSDAALKTAIQSALAQNQTTLLSWLENAPQTNESGRSAPLVAAGHLLAKHIEMPLRLLELGASAGLNLRWDHVALDLKDRYLGPENPGLILSPDWQGSLPEQANLKIASRAGVDLSPLDATNPDDNLRLLSFIWPDQPDRLTRMRAALDLAVTHPVKIAKADAIDWLSAQLNAPSRNTLTVIYHTVAWQYFPAERQHIGQKLIETHGAKATSQTPLAWLSMENDGEPNGAKLHLRLWPGQHNITLGRVDFHGRWVQWNVVSLGQMA